MNKREESINEAKKWIDKNGSKYQFKSRHNLAIILQAYHSDQTTTLIKEVEGMKHTKKEIDDAVGFFDNFGKKYDNKLLDQVLTLIKK